MIGALEKSIVTNIIKANPLFVVFSYLSHEHQFVIAILSKIKNKINGKIILVGPHTTINEELDNVDFDIVLNFNIEHAFDNRIQKGKINLSHNLNMIPFFNNSLYSKYRQIDRSKNLYIVTARGCDYSCTFCMHTAYKNLLGNIHCNYKSFSVEYVVSQLLQIKNFTNIERFAFIGPNLVKNKRWSMKFLKLYKAKIGLPFTCFVRFESLDYDVVRALKEANCDGVAVGLESGNDFIRNTVLKKMLSVNEIIKKSRLLHKHGVKFLTFNMIGLPNETLDNMLETLKINRMIKPDNVYCSIFFPIPGTPIFKDLEDTGVYRQEKLDTLFDTSKTHINTDNPNMVQRLYSLFYFLVYVPIPITIVKFLLTLPLDLIYKQFNNLYLNSSHYIGLSRADARKIF